MGKNIVPTLQRVYTPLLSFIRSAGEMGTENRSHQVTTLPNFRAIDVRRDCATLTTLEGAESAEIDKTLFGKIGRVTDSGLWHQVDMKLRTGADLEVVAKEHTITTDGDGALAPMNGIALMARIKCAVRDDPAALIKFRELLSHRRDTGVPITLLCVHLLTCCGEICCVRRIGLRFFAPGLMSRVDANGDWLDAVL